MLCCLVTCQSWCGMKWSVLWKAMPLNDVWWSVVCNQWPAVIILQYHKRNMLTVIKGLKSKNWIPFSSVVMMGLQWTLPQANLTLKLNPNPNSKPCPSPNHNTNPNHWEGDHLGMSWHGAELVATHMRFTDDVFGMNILFLVQHQLCCFVSVGTKLAFVEPGRRWAHSPSPSKAPGISYQGTMKTSVRMLKTSGGL